MSKDAVKTPKSGGAQAPGLKLEGKFVGKLTGTLLGICAVVALLLGCTNALTKPIIDQMKAEKEAQAMSQVLPAVSYEELGTDEENGAVLYAAWGSGAQLGYVVKTSGSGFGGTISMMVGVDMDRKVTGVAVTDESETSNIGTKVVRDQSVLDRFIGMSHDGGEITVNAGSNRFDGVTGATMSSKGVTAGVNAALRAVENAVWKELVKNFEPDAVVDAGK